MTNKGHYLIKEVLKAVQSEQTSTSEAGSEDNMTMKSIPTSPITQPQNQKRVILVKKEKNIYNRVFRLYPTLPSCHIYRLFGFMTINEKSLLDSDFEESYFSTYFNGRIIKKVQFYDNSIVLEMSPPVIPQHQPPVDYFVEKKKSQGGNILFQIANQVSEVYEMFKMMPKQETQEQKPQSIKKNLDNLGDSMYVCTLGVNKIAISKSLLNYLEYNLEEFGIQAVKYKTIFHEFFSAKNYANNILHLIKNLKHTVHLFQNKLNMNQYLKKTTLKFSDFIYSKTGVRSFCQMSFSMLNPSFFCHKIDFIYYKEGQASKGDIETSQQRLAIEGEKQRMRQVEYRLIQKLKDIPSHMLKQNQKFIAGYRQIQPKNSEMEQPK